VVVRWRRWRWRPPPARVLAGEGKSMLLLDGRRRKPWCPLKHGPGRGRARLRLENSNHLTQTRKMGFVPRPSAPVIRFFPKKINSMFLFFVLSFLS
jgi:hypothetical protein